MKNIGLDFYLLSDRISGSFDFSEMTLPACWDMLQPRLWPSTKPNRSTEAITTEEDGN